jgi:hypothetical protein
MATKTQTATRRDEDDAPVADADREATAVSEVRDTDVRKNATFTQSAEALERDEATRERAEGAAGGGKAVVAAEDAEPVEGGDSAAQPTIPRDVRAPVAPEPAPNQLPSHKFLPNAQRDAERFLQGAGVSVDRGGDVIVDARDAVRLAPVREPRDAKDLALFLRLNPLAVNYIDRLPEFERDVLGIAEPDAWVADPQDMLEEAKRYNMLFPNPRNNAQMTDPLSHVER